VRRNTERPIGSWRLRAGRSGAAAVDAALLLGALAAAGVLGLGALGTSMGGAISERGAGRSEWRAGSSVAGPVHAVLGVEAGTATALLRLAPPSFTAELADAGRAGSAGRAAASLEGALGVVPWKHVAEADLGALVGGVEARVLARVDADLAAAVGPGRTFENPGRTFENTVRPLVDALHEAEYASNVLAHLDSVLGSKKFSKGNAKAQQRLERLRARVLERGDVVDALTEVHRGLESAGLDSPERALAEKLLAEAGYPVHGRGLSAAERTWARELRAELGKLDRTYERNQTRAYKAFRVHVRDRADLKGLSAADLREARRNAKRAGKEGYLFEYDSAGTDDALTSLRSAETRKLFWEALHRVAADGASDNRPVVERMLALRQSLAELYGYRSYADYAVSERGPARRMLGTADEAEEFVDEMLARVRPLAERELDELRAHRRSVEGTAEMQPWDRAYWSARLYEKRFGDLDESKYLRLDRVLEGAFAVAERLLGVRLERADLPTWHGDVLSFRATDADGRYLGQVQMDLLERRGKHPGSWQADIYVGEGAAPSHVVVNSDVSPTGGRVEKTALNIDEAASIFHEVGHALHVLVTEAGLRDFGGTNVAQDFAEFPSQLLENWVWDEGALALFARHTRTGKPMPRKMAATLADSRRFGAALDYYDTLVEAKVDLGVHRHYRRGEDAPSSAADAESFAAEIVRRHALLGPGEHETFLTDFEHIFAGGYAAGYHGYSWGEVLEADAFERFREAGVFDEALGRELRGVLAQGATVPARDLHRRLVDREPSPDALLRRLGLEERPRRGRGK
jgi:oligopeptidase A